jgi:hypothetical protein
VPNIWVEELEVPPEGAAVVGDDDEVCRLLLQADASKVTATTTTNPMNVRLLCFTDPPCERRTSYRTPVNRDHTSLGRPESGLAHRRTSGY